MNNSTQELIKPRVLVIDDDDDLHLLVQAALEDSYTLSAAYNGADGLANACTDAPDLILLDRDLPHLPGLQVLRSLQENPSTRDIPVVLLTAQEEVEARVEGLEAGASDYIIKPFALPELAARISRLLREIARRPSVVKATATPGDPRPARRSADTVVLGSASSGPDAAEPSLALVGERVAGKYLVKELLAEGGMAAVYRVHHELLNQDMALKVIRPDRQHLSGFRQRFFQEAKIASQLTHENIVAMRDFGAGPGDRYYIAMDFFPGTTLREVALQEGALPPKAAYDLVTQLLSALAYAHERGIIHRDIKSDNVLLSPDGKVHVLDFGLAKIMHPLEEDNPRLTQAGMAVGTPLYMSPEQARGLECDGRSDLYSTGVLLYELLCGVLPLEGETSADILKKHLHEIPLPPSSYQRTISAGLDKVVLKALAKAPADRWQSAEEFRLAFHKALNSPDTETSIGRAVASRAVPELSSSPPSEQDSLDHQPRAGLQLKRILWPALAVALLVGSFALLSARNKSQIDAVQLRTRARALFGALPSRASSSTNPHQPTKIALGRKLFHDPQLSASGKMSCADCHPLERHGTTSATTPAAPGHKGTRNAPSVINAALGVALNWDGSQATVEEQAAQHLLDPLYMGFGSDTDLVERLRSQGYEDSFRRAFPLEIQPLSLPHVAEALGSFERTLIAPAPFDAFMEGSAELEPDELEGLQAFIRLGCAECHNGPLLGSTSFHSLGRFRPYQEQDPGRQSHTGQESDRGLFKVPSLRNVVYTGPYLHDGSVRDLADVVSLMATHQLGVSLAPAEEEVILAFLGTLTGSLPVAGATSAPPAPGAPVGLHDLARRTFGTLPAPLATPLEEPQVALGQLLFHDSRLSRGSRMACSTCHPLDQGGMDGRPLSLRQDTGKLARNVPTVLNAALQFAQFWDGRAATLEEQAAAVLLDDGEMALSSREELAQILQGIPDYQQRFREAFPRSAEPLTFENACRALAAFQEQLMTPARFDRYLEGDPQALNSRELEGLRTFVRVGCTTCHRGPLVGGTMFQVLGLKRSYPTEDMGRLRVTGQAHDRNVFKVPSLRNVARTGPYLHDGSLVTLEETVQVMATYQLGVELTATEVDALVAFLSALDGELSPKLSRKPDLPGSE